MKKKLLILIVVIGGLLMALRLTGEIQKQKEEQRNREYEVSLVKALKNSYRDLEEIELSSPDYSVPPGDWNCTVQLTFSDGQVVEYFLGHSLYLKINKSAITNDANSEVLSNHYGSTKSKVKVIFSNGEEEIQ
ncbi:hypothetical protein BU202_06600 [Streptococcus cuniculi]|uniref:DUF1310 family protein n=1 Tax=Streptococcus cuniculi TaxID=1432788 RepID=A0A1Q8E7C3_9STRE|nr:hypothetical protein [Streptococcus cuniculi]OLF47695.1 hypothetical protein BU202_06600 [Streptococcus cuniculi]